MVIVDTEAEKLNMYYASCRWQVPYGYSETSFEAEIVEAVSRNTIRNVV
jgi:hypothetical protein